MLIHNYFKKIICIYTRSCNENGIGTIHSCSTKHILTEMYGLSLWDKNEQIAVGGHMEPIRQSNCISCRKQSNRSVYWTHSFLFSSYNSSYFTSTNYMLFIHFIDMLLMYKYYTKQGLQRTLEEHTNIFQTIFLISSNSPSFTWDVLLVSFFFSNSVYFYMQSGL